MLAESEAFLDPDSPYWELGMKTNVWKEFILCAVLR